MFNNSVTVLEIGSSKLKAMVVTPAVNDTFVQSNSAEIEYDGYFQGEFIDLQNFKDALQKLFNSMNYVHRKYTKKIYVGLPAEFVTITTEQASMNFKHQKTIKKSMIEKMFESACENIYSGDSDVVSVSPIAYTLDDEMVTTFDPVGKKANSITADISIVLAKRALIEKFNKIFFDMQFERIEYLSETLAQAQFVIPKEDREDICLLVDCGHLTTSVSFVQGEGLLETQTFSVGGGHISGDLSEIFELTYKDAEAFKSQVVLSLQGGLNDKYDFTTEGGQNYKINLNEANNGVAYRIEEIGKIIEQSINEIPTNLTPYMPIYLVGCGLSCIKGGKNLLAKYLGKNINEGVVAIPGKDKPEHTTIYAIAQYATKISK